MFVRAWAVLVAAVILVGCHRDQAIGPQDRPWTTADFEQLAATEGCGPLPGFGTARFERMIDPAVLAAVAPLDQPVAQRIPALVAYQDAWRAVVRRYERCGDAATLLSVFTPGFELYGQLLPVMEKFLATFPPDDPTYRVRAGGLEQMREGLVGMATGVALMVRGNAFRAPVPGIGLRLGAALARAKTLLPAGALDTALANLDVDPSLDDDPHRRALRADIVTGLHAPVVP